MWNAIFEETILFWVSECNLNDLDIDRTVTSMTQVIELVHSSIVCAALASCINGAAASARWQLKLRNCPRKMSQVLRARDARVFAAEARRVSAITISSISQAWISLEFFHRFPLRHIPLNERCSPVWPTKYRMNETQRKKSRNTNRMRGQIDDWPKNKRLIWSD